MRFFRVVTGLLIISEVELLWMLDEAIFRFNLVFSFDAQVG